MPGPTTQMAPAPLLIDPGSYLLDWCGFVFQSMPEAVQGVQCRVIPTAGAGDAGVGLREPHRPVRRGRDGPHLLRPLPSVVLGRRQPVPAAARIPGVRRARGRGLEMPERIQWSGPGGIKDERLPLEPTVGDVLNDQFHRLVRGQHSLAPTIRDALVIARLVRDVRRSQREGGAVVRSS